MKRRSQTTPGVFMFLVLLMVVAIAAAQATIARSSNGPADMTSAAGTDGRGGVDARTTGAPTTSPPAGTLGRGGVVAAHAVIAAAGPTMVSGGSTSPARGGFPSGPSGSDRTITGSSAAALSAGWIAAGLVAATIALAAGFFAWSANRRRVWQRQSALGSFCTYHPSDALC